MIKQRVDLRVYPLFDLMLYINIIEILLADFLVPVFFVI